MGSGVLVEMIFCQLDLFSREGGWKRQGMCLATNREREWVCVYTYFEYIFLTFHKIIFGGMRVRATHFPSALFFYGCAPKRKAPPQVPNNVPQVPRKVYYTYQLFLPDKQLLYTSCPPVCMHACSRLVEATTNVISSPVLPITVAQSHRSHRRPRRHTPVQVSGFQACLCAPRAGTTNINNGNNHNPQEIIISPFQNEGAALSSVLGLHDMIINK
jgi:hypothetical protein